MLGARNIMDFYFLRQKAVMILWIGGLNSKMALGGTSTIRTQSPQDENNFDYTYFFQKRKVLFYNVISKVYGI
jgi:hypothetical protein